MLFDIELFPKLLQSLRTFMSVSFNLLLRQLMHGRAEVQTLQDQLALSRASGKDVIPASPDDLTLSSQLTVCSAFSLHRNMHDSLLPKVTSHYPHSPR